MNERIRELAREAGGHPNCPAFRGHYFPPRPSYSHPATVDLSKFAELIVLECIRIIEMGGTPNRIREHFGVTEAGGIKVGSRVRVIAGFGVGAKGVVNYIEPSGKLWVRRDGASSDVYYHLEELVGVEE